MVKVIQGYILNQVIGEGNFGLVYRATHKEKGGVFAVKVIPIQKFHENQRLQTYQNNQIQALQAIGVSDYIIRFYEIIKSKNNCYLVYEYCNGGTLLNVLRRQQRLEQKKALVIFRQLLQAFKILNKNSIMHRDLKPENIFFTSQNQQEGTQNNNQNDKKKVKLGDFGFCKGLKPDQNLAKTMLGSPIYMAPQVLKGQAYTTKADIWSLGVILFQMLYGYCPYQSKSIASLISTIDTQPVQLPNKYQVSERTQNLIKRMLTKDYFRRIGWVELFNIKIDQNGQYIQEYNPMNLTVSEDRGSTPNKKVFSSLFGSLSIGSTQLPGNNRSYSTRLDQQNQKRNQLKPQSKISIRKQIQQDNGNSNSNDKNNNSLNNGNNNSSNNKPSPLIQTRVNSQPKDQKRFYSQNYINILSTPLSIKKIQNQSNNDDRSSRQKSKLLQNMINIDKDKTNQKKVNPMSPAVFKQQKITSMDNLELVKQQSVQSIALVGSNSVEPIPFNKYRQNIGMGSRLSNQFLSDRSIKQPTRHSNSQYTPSNLQIQIPIIQNQSQGPPSQIVDLNVKRNSLLKIHESITKIINKAMVMLQQKFFVFKNSRQLSDFCLVKDLLQDCYIVLKIVQQKLKSITQSIKITQTSLLDMATIVNYQHIQVEKFIIQVRNQLIRCSVELPNMPSGLHLSKVDRVQNANNFKEMIKNRIMAQIVDDYS